MKKMMMFVTVLFFFFCFIVGEDNIKKQEFQSKDQVNIQEQDTTNEPVPMPIQAEPSISIGKENALSKAMDYLNYSSFSKNGLKQQLEYEGFSHEEACYASDNCNANWKEQASNKAQDYLNYSSFSRSGLIEQLEYEGFTHEEAVYGTDSTGY